MRQEEQRAIVRQGSFAELVVKAATACNKVITENCGLCTLYCDKQVQYESVVEKYAMDAMGNPLGNLFNKLDNSMEVQVYRGFLFDEDSVVETASSRQEDE
jgi:hypothetical protein